MSLEWMRRHFTGHETNATRFLTSIVQHHPDLCDLFERDGVLYISYKRAHIARMHREVDMACIERGMKHLGMYCPEHRSHPSGWKTWTWWADRRVPRPPPGVVIVSRKRERACERAEDNTTPPTMKLAKTLPAPTFPDFLNTKENIFVFLPREPEPIDIDGSWIDEL